MGRHWPGPVTRVRIPKPDGGVGELGIPTVTDRLIRQALLWVLQRRSIARQHRPTKHPNRLERVVGERFEAFASLLVVASTVQSPRFEFRQIACRRWQGGAPGGASRVVSTSASDPGK